MLGLLNRITINLHFFPAKIFTTEKHLRIKFFLSNVKKYDMPIQPIYYCCIIADLPALTHKIDLAWLVQVIT